MPLAAPAPPNGLCWSTSYREEHESAVDGSLVGANLPVPAPALKERLCSSALHDESTILQVAAAWKGLVCQCQRLHPQRHLLPQNHMWSQTCHQLMLHLGSTVSTTS